MTDRARENRLLAWLIVGTSATLTLALAGVLIVWAYGRAREWAAAQQAGSRTEQGPVIAQPLPPTFPELEELDERRKGDGGIDGDGEMTVRAPLSVPPGSARPLGDVASWVTPDDYPAAALRAESEGRTRVTLTVAGGGQPIACAVAVSSGHDTLDRATCRAMMLRGRFNPPGGTRRWTSPYIRWQLPER